MSRMAQNKAQIYKQHGFLSEGLSKVILPPWETRHHCAATQGTPSLQSSSRQSVKSPSSNTGGGTD